MIRIDNTHFNRTCSIAYRTTYIYIYTHRSGRLPGPYVFTGKTLLSAGRPRQSVARGIGANFGLSKFCCFCKGNGTNYGSTSQGARSPVFTLIPFRNRVIWTGNHNIRPFVRIVLGGSLSCIPWKLCY